VARRIDLDKLGRENRRLRAENRKLKRELDQTERRVALVASRVEALQEKQSGLAETADRTDDLLRWLRARMQALERELSD
jgi:cell division septum initiation protein DivIVA